MLAAIVVIIAVLGLTASNIFLIFVIYRTKLMEKSETIAEYKEAIKPLPPKKEKQALDQREIIEVPLF